MKEELRKNWKWIVIAFLVGFVVFMWGERNSSRLYESMIIQNQQLLVLKARTEQALKTSPAQTQQYFKQLGYNIQVTVPQEEEQK